MGNHLKPNEILKITSDIGLAKAESPLSKLVILGILAGAFIAFGAEASNMAAMGLLSKQETVGIGRLVAGAIFTPGLMLVLLAGAELFTGDVLMLVPTLEKRISVGTLIRILLIVYVSNLAGGVMVAWAMNYTGLFETAGGMLGATTVKIAVGKVSLSFGRAVVLGILCNWLVCLAVWISFGAASTTGKIFSVFFPICLFVTSGFEHSVANMYYIPAGIFAKSEYGVISGAAQAALDNLTWGGFFGNNLLPVTIGNLIGGMVFVALASSAAFGKKNHRDH